MTVPREIAYANQDGVAPCVIVILIVPKDVPVKEPVDVMAIVHVMHYGEGDQASEITWKNSLFIIYP